MSYRLPFFLLIALIFLLIISQLTRFENLVIVTYDGHTLLAQVHDTVVGAEADDAKFYNMTASFQKSASGDSGFDGLRVYDDGDSLVYSSSSKPVLYLFGRDVLDTMTKGKYPNFWQTFGDWGNDNFRSNTVLIYNETLPPKFKMYIYLIGRGKQTVSLIGTPTSFYIDIVDGRIGHNVYLCGHGTGKCHGAATLEPVTTNLMRITNFFVEAFAGAFLFVILILIVLKKDD